MKSILQDEHCCFVCGVLYPLHKHHIFYGRNGNRPLSEKYGCWIYLCPWHHNASYNSVHFNHVLDLKIKKMCQEEFQRYYNVSIERFIEIFGRSYL